MKNIEDIAKKSYPVIITDYKSSWLSDFHVMGKILRKVLGETALRIDHIGSTSVPDLAAKDFIDIQVTVKDLGSMESFEERMLGADFQQRGNFHYDCFCGIEESESPELKKKYFREPEGERRCHIHVRQEGLLNQRYALLFRDFLRLNSVVRKSYEILKRRLTRLFPESINGYLYIKDPLMDIIFSGAEYWALNTEWKPDDEYL